MSAVTAFLRKEALETARTWRIWVLPGVLLLMAVASPVLASIMPGLVKSMAMQPGITIELPPATWTDAYGQWLKNLSQLVLWVVILSAGGVVSAEHRSGTAILVLTKPLSRTAFVLARTAAWGGLLVFATAAGTAVCFATTVLIFPGAPAGPLLSLTAVWLALALTLTAVMVLASALVQAQAAAAGIGFGALVLIYLSALWGPLARFGPAALTSAPGELLSGGDPPLGWPLATSAALCALCVALACAGYRRREL